MSENTSIEWADHTFNPWEGCQKVGPGCDNCYAEARNARFAGGRAINWGPGAPRRRTSTANWKKPLKWNSQRFMECGECGWRGACKCELIGCGACGSSSSMNDVRPRVFCASLADVFDNELDPEWRRDLFELIEATPNLDWLLLTKRIGNVSRLVADAKSHDWLAGQKNVWLGATIVNQEEADRDIPKLLATPAAKRFLSIEPMLGPIDLEAIKFGPPCDGCGEQVHLDALTGNTSCLHACDGPYFGEMDWVIVGGESGPNARPMHPDWARSLRDQCKSAGVPFLFKQWGEWIPMMGHDEGVPVRGEKFKHGDGTYMGLAGKKAAGRLLDGVRHEGFPRGEA